MSNIFATPWTVACPAPLSMGFPRQVYWGRLPFPTPRDLPDPGIEPAPPALAGIFFPAEPPGKPAFLHTPNKKAFGENATAQGRCLWKINVSCTPPGLQFLSSVFLRGIRKVSSVQDYDLTGTIKGRLNCPLAICRHVLWWPLHELVLR